MARDDTDEEIGLTGSRTRTKTRTRTRSSRTGTTRRVRAAAPQGRPPLPVAWIAGATLGAAAGVAVHLWERGVLDALGVAAPLGADRAAALAVNAAFGAVFGAWASATGLYGPRWASAAAVTFAGWLGAAALGRAAADAGVPAVLGVAGGVALAVAAGQAVGRVPAPAGAHQGLAVALTLGLAVGAPLHVWALPGPTAGGSVLATAVVALAAVAAAGGAAAVARADRAPWLPIGVGIVLPLTALGAASLRPPPRPPAPVAGPRVVVIVASGLRADRVAALRRAGPRRGDPPPLVHIDRLAARSVVYLAAEATSSWTIPSVGSMLTGLLPQGHGAGVHDGEANTLAPLRPDVPTVARLVRGAGLRTFGIAGDPELRAFALDAGFDRWRDDPGRGARPAVLEPLGVAGLDPTRWPAVAPADRVADGAVAALEALDHSGEGGLVWVQLADAGDPASLAGYEAALDRVDRAVGRVVDAAPADAWVVLVGDRGVELDERRPRTARGRRTHGHTLHTELVHVPLLVRAPGVAPARVSEPVTLADVAPTVLAALGVRAPEGLDGVRLGAPLGESQRPRTLVAQAVREGPEQRRVRVGRYALIQAGPRRTAVYDLEEDPAEAEALGEEARENDVRERKMEALLPPVGAGSRPPGRPPAGADLAWLVRRVWGRTLP